MTPPRSRDNSGSGTGGGGRAGGGRAGGGRAGGGRPGGQAGGGRPGGGRAGGGRPGGQAGGGRAGGGRAGGGPRPSEGGRPERPQRGSSGTTKKSQPTRVPRERDVPVVDVHDPDGVRLQKLLAAAGVGSRRVCENLIAAGRVEVDGHVVTELGVRIRPEQIVHVDGVKVQLDETRVYFAFNKPLNVVTTMSDELGRINIGDYVKDRTDRLFHVGRLDADTEGLLILTNDGELAHRLQHPQYGVLKTYLAQIRGPVPRDMGRILREGVELEDGPASVDSFRVVDSQPGKALVEVVLHEGRKHIVRRLLDAVGHPVLSLVRVQVGPIHLGDTKPGKMRKLTKEEVGRLYTAAGM
ncbi:pseudouridine synthase [Pedococcus dokdonensis]|uniref:pseudouridine synthase n=1 Tax=Pedococcus dokdonensis TaxID=443156 RepID=UPI000B814B57|nr:pseudouridine synthase [Pedococcus dokdonensis]